jgi:hypothetical protein
MGAWLEAWADKVAWAGEEVVQVAPTTLKLFLFHLLM